MGHQIRFYLCDEMVAVIEGAARDLGVTLVRNSLLDQRSIQFSRSSGTDTKQGRLWTEASDLHDYRILCDAVKRDAAYDTEAQLWVKGRSRGAFESYREKVRQELADLVEKNRRYAIDVLGGQPKQPRG